MTRPTVSIVTPCYNYANFVGETIKSCLAQTEDVPNIEIFIVNDASTDNSWEVIQSWMKKDKRVKGINLEKNGGYSHAKNEAIIQSKGEFITTIDADDMLTPHSLKYRLKTFKRNPGLQWVHANAYTFKGNKDYAWCCKEMPRLHIHQGTRIHAQSVMMRRTVYEEYGLYDEELRSKSDKEMWKRLLFTLKIEPIKIKPCVAFYRRHENSMIRYRKKFPDYNAEVLRIHNKNVEMRQREGVNKRNTRFIPKEHRLG